MRMEKIKRERTIDWRHVHDLVAFFIWGIPLFLIFCSFGTMFPVFLFLQENEEA